MLVKLYHQPVAVSIPLSSIVCHFDISVQFHFPQILFPKSEQFVTYKAQTFCDKV